MKKPPPFDPKAKVTSSGKALGKGGGPPFTRHVGKGSKQEMLPSRHAVDRLTGGDPVQRSMGNYSKLTPSGAGAPGRYADIIDLGTAGASVPGKIPPIGR